MISLTYLPSAKAPVRFALRKATSLPFLRAGLRSLSQRGLLPAALWRRLPIEGVISIALPTANDPESEFKYVAVGDGIARAIYWNGWEVFGQGAGIFYQLAKRSNLILDVGANTGIYSLVALAANPSARVIAFEPVPSVFRLLEKNLEVNKWQQRCRAVCAAVAESPGRAQLVFPRCEVPGNGYLSAHVPDSLPVESQTPWRMAAEDGSSLRMMSRHSARTCGVWR